MKDWISKAAEEIVAKGRWTACDDVATIISKHHERIVKPVPGYVQDWAAACGAYLHAEGMRLSSHRIAAVVAHFAEPLVALLREARREHIKGCLALPIAYTDDDGNQAEIEGAESCTCGADAWNARVDAALAGAAEEP